MKKLFSVKVFIMLVCVSCMGILLVANAVDKKNKEAFEKKKQEAEDNPLAAYETGKTASFADYLEYCGWKETDIDKIVIGYGLNGSGVRVNKYYIDDKDIIKEVLNELNRVTFVGAIEEAYDEFKDGKVWSIQLIKGEELYSIKFAGYKSSYDIAQFCGMHTVRADYCVGGLRNVARICDVLGYFPIIYGEGIYEKIKEIYNEYIDEITIDTIKKLREERSLEVTDYFRYKHNMERSRDFKDEINHMRTTFIYKFPIKDTECYMEVEKYNEYYEDSGPNHEIVRVEIFNQAGENIDLFEATDEEFQNFLK